ncbi:hypothetical protein EHQ16_01980 [Leptospira kanakyensis]|uniref:Uncharacterized protein n=1 Tax=Leptospira kanakyensis TaxID=2484968 RepID=A0A6N4Q8N2_9LEPT|nr:hypothetical protein [Leptospira kanakyensis]TGK47745.1 hypothetical protein EHQ11_17650 [Leptospira kanakyensis]TGK63255.1 hypothetical protein EHQ16_01980 [Leptospira kanakyensis]TGK66862.1 hypothetical protein EHQ18_17215 [Leptospira kanakyensis]
MLFVLFSTDLSPKERKVIRFSGELVRWEAQSPEPQFRYLDSTSLREKTIFCDADTMRLALGNQPYEKRHIEGKATQVSPTSDIWLCVGKPHIFQKYQVSVNSPSSQGKRIQGQVIEADGETGQIVYLVRGRRSYMTIEPSLAKEMAESLSRMQTVEIDGDYHYDRIKRYYIKD